MMSKWDTIQEDVKDAYVHLDEYDDELENDSKDIFGFGKAIQIDHLTDEQLDMIADMFDKDI